MILLSQTCLSSLPRSRFTRPVAFAGGRRRQANSPKLFSPRPRLQLSPVINGRIGPNHGTMQNGLDDISSSSSSGGGDDDHSAERLTQTEGHDLQSPSVGEESARSLPLEEVMEVVEEANPSEQEDGREDEQEDEDDRTIVGDVTVPDSEPLENEGSTEESEEGGTESEIELALEVFGNRNRRRQWATVEAGAEVEDRRSPLWDGLRRGAGSNQAGGRALGQGRLNGTLAARRNLWGT